jgi:hypothetical protein
MPVRKLLPGPLLSTVLNTPGIPTRQILNHVVLWFRPKASPCTVPGEMPFAYRVEDTVARPVYTSNPKP